MKLLTLSITNFRGAPPLDIKPQGKNVNIYGANGAGKTSTEDAFLWLLFGKDSADRKDYDLIPHKPGVIPPEPDVGCGKEPTVEATLEYFGKTVRLKKSYIEEWPKRGDMKGQYAGSKTHFYVDDLEVKAGEYQQVVSELVDDKLFKLITNPHYFSEALSWQERRETLVKIAGELFVAPAPELAALMEDGPFDKFHALAKQNVKNKQKELDGLPYAITEARRMVPATLPAVQDIGALTAEKATLEEQLLALKNDDAENARRREQAEIETQIAEARNKYLADINAQNAKIKAGIEKLTDEQQDKTDVYHKRKSDVLRLEDEIECLTGLKLNKLAQWHEANDRVWTGSDVCPTCGQPLPADQIETAKAAFNRQRSEDLERLKSEGLALKQQIDEKTAGREEKRILSDTLDSEIATLDARIDKGRAMIKESHFGDTDEYMALAKQLDALKTGTQDGSKAEKIDVLTARIQNAQNYIDAANRAKLQIEAAAEQQKHIDELMQQEKDINAELSKWEKAVSLCEQHVKKSAKALEQAVNGKFQIARFRMFQMQKNGEEAECCDVIYPNGSTTLSTGERLQTGIDIINTLTGYYGVDAPIWIDNAEGVTLPISTQAQIIRLIVLDEEEKLRVEVQA
jgi:hypothetical protein